MMNVLVNSSGESSPESAKPYQSPLRDKVPNFSEKNVQAANPGMGLLLGTSKIKHLLPPAHKTGC